MADSSTVKYVPEWMIGAGFKKWARQAQVYATATTDVPFATVTSELRAGTAKPSILASLRLERMNSELNVPVIPGEELVARNVAAAAYLGGADTTVSAMNTFILTMLLFPKVQKKAQAELGEVIGMDRLPEISDSEFLPYINALCKEVIRWHPVVPFAVPHRVIQDDGLFTSMDLYSSFAPILNYSLRRLLHTWGKYCYRELLVHSSTVTTYVRSRLSDVSRGMLHDERTYGPEPDNFRPERYLDPKVKFPMPAFGFGRRCVIKDYTLTIQRRTHNENQNLSWAASGK
ncbi:cytochrome P450 [Ramaria rubella]|nr:cytochrome P450 [Ramaria rubella]